MSEQLFYESLNEALRTTIAACGGSKVVACKLWPEKSPDAAHRALIDALNENRPEKLSPDQVLLICKIGRANNCHAAINYIAQEAGYEAKPIDPEDEKAKLMRDFIEATKVTSRLAERMEQFGLIRTVA